MLQGDFGIEPDLPAQGPPAVAEGEILAAQLPIHQARIEERPARPLRPVRPRAGVAQVGPRLRHLPQGVPAQAQETAADPRRLHEPGIPVERHRRPAGKAHGEAQGIGLPPIGPRDDTRVMVQEPQEILGLPFDIRVDEDEIPRLAFEEIRDDGIARLHDEAALEQEIDIRGDAVLVQQRPAHHQRADILHQQRAIEARGADHHGTGGHGTRYSAAAGE